MEAAFQDAGFDCARLDAEILLGHILNWHHMKVYSFPEKIISNTEQSLLDKVVARRLSGEPVAYITGNQEFWSLSFKVSRDTLIPRADTETLVDVTLKNLKGHSKPHILDLGTGTGCILLSLLHDLPDATGIGADLSAGSVVLARDNAAALKLDARAEFLTSDWFEAVPQSDRGTGRLFDAIVSNPPYIPAADIAGLMRDVRDFEPMSALAGGADGLDPYRIITAQAPEFLAEGGLLAVELGIGQDHDVARLFSAAGLVDIVLTADLAGINRVVSGKKAT